jgi:hypothetical protein
MPKNKRKSKGRDHQRVQASGSGVQNVDTNILRPFDSTIKFKHHARYLASANITNQPVTRGNMLSTLLVNLAGSTNNARIIAGVKLNRIELYYATDFHPISVEWLSNYGPTTEKSDQTLTTASTACVKTSPPRNSLASFWTMTGSNESEILMLLTGQATMLVDVYSEFVLFDGETVATQSTTASGVTGTLYLTSFDGPNSAAKLVPQSYTTIN